jgi:hypothetical protein
LLWIGIAALALRFLYLYLNPRPLASDELDYNALAVNLATHFRYAFDSIPTAYRPVGYPAFVSFVYLLFGIQPVVVKIAQAIVDSAIVFLLPLLLQGFSERSKLLAAGVWAFFPPAVLYTNMLMSESLYTTLLVVGTVLFVAERPNVVWKVLLGVLFGYLTLMKPETLVIVVGVVAVGFVLSKSRKDAVALLLPILLIVTPWVVRNWAVVGEPVLATNSGINLLIGNNPNANGSYSARFDLPQVEAASDEGVRDRTAFHSAVTYIVSHPGAFFLNAAKKYAHVFSSESFLLVTQFDNDSSDKGLSLAKRYAGVALLPVIVVNGSYILVLIVGWLGFLTSGRNRLWYFFATLLASFLIVHMITFGGNRFHFPLMPFLAVFAVQSLANSGRDIGALSRSKKIVFALSVLSVLTVWMTELVIVLRA